MKPTTEQSLPLTPYAWFWSWPQFLLGAIGFASAIILGVLYGVPNHIHIITIVMGLVTGLGITVGFHRLFTHRSFDTYKPIEWLFAIVGNMAGQGSLYYWVSEHRKHHQFSDQPGDPHSPHPRQFWHAHLYWFLRHEHTYDPRLVRDLSRRADLRWIERNTMIWFLAGLVGPAAVAGACSESWFGALMGLLWGGLFRAFVVSQFTYCINSVAHCWGQRDHKTHDDSRNNVVLGLLAFGEGWHNNHHAFPYSARHGLLWWQFDLSWCLIWFGKQVGLVWNVRTTKPRTSSIDSVPTASTTE